MLRKEKLEKVMDSVLSNDTIRLANRRRSDKRLVVLYMKGKNKAFPSHKLSNKYIKAIESWVKDKKFGATEVEKDVFRIDFEDDVFIFEVFQDENGIVLTGYVLKRNIEVRKSLVDLQVSYLIGEQVA